MWFDPRRSGVALWVLWSAGGALGGGLSTLLAFGWLGAIVSGDGPAGFPYDLKIRAYFGTLAAIVALFQALLLAFIAPGKRAALLWLLAGAIGAGLFYLLLRDLVFNVSLSSWFTSLPVGTRSAILGGAYAATYTLGLALAQGLALALITARKMAPAVWVAGSFMALPVSMYFAQMDVGPSGAAASFIASNGVAKGAGAAVTGLALILILRLGRRDNEKGAPKVAAALQGQG